MKRSPMPPRRAPMKRSAMKARPKRNPMPDGRVDEVQARDGYRCQAAAYNFRLDVPCAGRLETHHRQGRGMGGTKDPATHDLSNLVTLCATHHRLAESHRTEAFACGIAVRRNTA